MEQDRQILGCILSLDIFRCRMRCDQAWQILEDRFGHLVGQVVAQVRPGDQNVGDGYRWHFHPLAVIGIGRNGGRLVSGIADFLHDVGRDGHEHHRQCRRQVTDSCLAEARRLQSGIQLTILDQFDGLCVRQVFDLAHITVSEPRCPEDGPCVELRA